MHAVKVVIESCQKNWRDHRTVRHGATRALDGEHLRNDVYFDGAACAIDWAERGLPTTGRTKARIPDGDRQGYPFDPRYGKGLETHSHLFDMGMMLSPATRSQKYVGVLKGSTVGQIGNFVADASAVRARVDDQFTDLVAQSIQTRRSREDAEGADGEALMARRSRVSNDGDATKPLQVEQLKNAGMFDSDGDSEDDASSAQAELSP